ncbi:MAG: DNA mismatch repair protein MutS [Alphaproteobacteria bacterium]|nr:DNA mismatch repair protein MutS [Alphaproteobacteria bacterium]
MGSTRARTPRGSPDDAIAWWWITRDVTPLPGRRKPERPEAAREAAPKPPHPAPPPKQAKAVGGDSSQRPALKPGEAAGLDRATLRRLTRGQFAIDDTLDLHGHTRVQAHAALVSFLASRRGASRTCVLVVTGRGREGPGVLKDLVPRWLNEPATRALVLGFATALPRHGGAGALYVLLRKRG